MKVIDLKKMLDKYPTMTEENKALEKEYLYLEGN